MKKILMVAATLLLVVGFVACSKSDDAPVAKDIKIEFSVADKAVFNGTRAVKTAWADGDKIMLFFKVGGSWLAEANSKANTVTLTYNAAADEWSAVKNSWSDALTNSTSGSFMAVHYRGDIALGNSHHLGVGYYFATFGGGEYLSANGNYAIEDGVMTLPTLAMEMPSNMVQFSVKNLASNSDEWELLINFDREPADFAAADGASPVNALNENKIMFRTDYDGLGQESEEWMSNVVNGDDRSFVATIDGDNDEVTEKYVFILNNLTKNKKYAFVYAPSPFAKFEGKTAYVLPELLLEADGYTPASGCMWTLF